MNAYETSATVEPNGQLRLASVPFAPGTEVEVIISAKRGSPEEFVTQWSALCSKMRAKAGDISDEQIQKEIDAHRAGT